jgi:hypothetical protein
MTVISHDEKFMYSPHLSISSGVFCSVFSRGYMDMWLTSAGLIHIGMDP